MPIKKKSTSWNNPIRGAPCCAPPAAALDGALRSLGARDHHGRIRTPRGHAYARRRLGAGMCHLRIIAPPNHNPDARRPAPRWQDSALPLRSQ